MNMNEADEWQGTRDNTRAGLNTGLKLLINNSKIKMSNSNQNHKTFK